MLVPEVDLALASVKALYLYVLDVEAKHTPFNWPRRHNEATFGQAYDHCYKEALDNYRVAVLHGIRPDETSIPP